MRLIDKLEKYRDSHVYPMHMPGHKRNKAFHFPSPYGIDVTEIDGFDNLHDAKGILLECKEKASKLYGSDRTFFLINGSTCGILAGVSASTKKGDRILVARNCHQSVYHAILLNELDPVYLVPSVDESFGIQGSISPEAVQKAIDKDDAIKLVIITSPTYEGVVSDISAIAAITHKKGIPLLVDEAHGAHFGLSAGFPESSVQVGADIVIHSLHKTLPAFTQSALLHLNGDLVSPYSLEKQLAIFESSSPSYILMAGIDSCIDLLCHDREKLFAQFLEMLRAFSDRMRDLNRIQIFCFGRDALHLHGNVFGFDPGKIVISVRNTDMNGKDLYDFLLRDYQIQLEMACKDFALAMTSICDTEEGFTRLGDALLEIDKSLNENNKCPVVTKYLVPESRMSIYCAESAEGKFISPDQSIGEISREFVYAYPPGIPIIVPGEIINEEIVRQIKKSEEMGVGMKSTYGKLPDEINVVS